MTTPQGQVPEAPGMAVQALAGEIVEALLADRTEGYDLEAGLFGRAFSTLVRRWAAVEYATPAQVSAVESNTAGAVTPDGEPSNVELRGMWYGAGGSFHGPNVETGTMPEAKLLPFLRSLASHGQAPAGAADWWRNRADEIEVQVAATGSQEAMRCYTDMRTLLQAAAAQPTPATQQAGAEPLHITHGPLMRHAAYLLRSRKPVMPEHESVAAELELAVDGHPTPSGEPSAEWLEVARIAERQTSPTAQAAPAADLQPNFTQLRKALADRRFRGETDLQDLVNMAANVIAEDGDVISGQRSVIDMLKAAPAAGAVAGPGVTVRVGTQEFDLANFDEHFTSADMHTASVQAFREGQAAAAPTPAAQADSGVQEDAARWEWIAAHWKTVNFRFNKLTGQLAGLTLTVDAAKVGSGAEALEREIDAARAQQKEGL